MECQRSEVAKFESLSDFPLFVVEEPHNILRGGVNTKCRGQGGLHESRLGNTKRVHIYEMGPCGVYIGSNFGMSPHYNIPSEHLLEFEKEASYKNIPTKRYQGNKHHSNEVMTIMNMTGVEKDCTDTLETSLLKEINNLDIDSLYHDLVKKKTGVSAPDVDPLRGVTQKHFGYSGNHSLKRTEDGQAEPILINEGEMDSVNRERFATMTRLSQTLFSHRKKRVGKEIYPTIFSDNGPHLQMSAKIHPENRIDAMTHSLSSKQFLLHIHCDTLNDDSKLGIKGNYNHVVAAWKCYKTPGGVVDRMVVLGYSRRSVSDLIKRKDCVQSLHDEKLGPWIRRQGKWRTRVDVDHRIFNSEYFPEPCYKKDSQSGIMGFCPIFNKQAGLLSGYADAILQLYAAYPTKMNSIHKRSELFLCLVFCNTAEKFRAVVIGEWIRKGNLPKKENLLKSMLSLISSRKELGSLSSGLFRRHQPSFNRPMVSYKWISGSLHIIKNTILFARRAKSATFSTITAKLCCINGVGQLIAQHITHLMSMVSDIPSRFAAQAKVCETTATYRRLEEKHGLSKGRLPTLIAILDRIYGWPSSVSENVICKWAIDESHGKADLEPNMKDSNYYDCIYPEQDLVLYYWKSGCGKSGIRIVRRRNHKTAKLVNSSIEFAPYLVEKWTDLNSTSVHNDPCSNDDLLWTSKIKDDDRGFCYVSFKGRQAADPTTLITQNECHKNESRNRRVRSVFQQTRWGTVLSSDPEQGRSHWGPVKRRRKGNHTFLFQSSTEFWRDNDIAKFRKDEIEFLRSKYTDKTGNNDVAGEGSHHLRYLHREGRMKGTNDRECTRYNHVTTKSTTTLLTLGVVQLVFDIHQAAAVAIGFKHYGDLCSMIKVNAVGNGFYTSMTRQDGQVVTLSRKFYYVSLYEGRENLEDNGLDVDFPIVYDTKKAATNGFLWFLCSVYGLPELWINRMYKGSEWTSISQKNGEFCVDGDSTRYLLLHRGGRGKGNAFATLVLTKDMVYIQMHYSASTEKHRHISKMIPDKNCYRSLFTLMKGNPYNMGLPGRKERCRRNKPSADPLLLTEMDVGEKKEGVPPGLTEITFIQRSEFVLTFLKSKRGGERLEMVTMWPDTPLLGMTSPNLENSKMDFLQLSQSLWSKRIQDWFSYVMFRSADRGSCDRYWIPPFAHPSKSLRSTKEVYGYLLKGVEYMKLKGIEKTAVLTEDHFFQINKGWWDRRGTCGKKK
jgi:hypothetical protein